MNVYGRKAQFQAQAETIEIVNVHQKNSTPYLFRTTAIALPIIGMLVAMITYCVTNLPIFGILSIGLGVITIIVLDPMAPNVKIAQRIGIAISKRTYLDSTAQ